VDCNNGPPCPDPIGSCVDLDANSKWIVTCQKDYKRIETETRNKIGDFQIEAQEFEITENIHGIPADRLKEMRCHAHKFSMTCDFNWKKALDKLKTILKGPSIINAAKAFCPYVDPYEGLDVENIDCGKRKLSSGRVWGGEEVERSSIPWQVAIFDHNFHSEKFPICGGTLISPWHVLTAAHCIEHPNDCWRYSVGIGMHHGDIGDGTRIFIHHINNHPAYNPNHCGVKLPNIDYSVLHLITPFTLNNKVQPACLPDNSMFYDFLVGKNLTVSGWGSPHRSLLHKATYPAVSNLDCIRIAWKCIDYIDCKNNCKLITSNMFCAGYPKNRPASTGEGDSGGPVTYDNNGRETVVGVVSWDSITPLEPGTMSVYARVTAVLRWIKKEMKTNYDRC